MNLATEMGRLSGRATPSLQDGPSRQSNETGRRSTYLLPIAVQTNRATSDNQDADSSASYQAGAIKLRSNVINGPNAWWAVPGDIIEQWRPNWFDRRSADATQRQKNEKDYFRDCSQCKRSVSRINAEGCQECRLAARLPSLIGFKPEDPMGRQSADWNSN